MLAIITHSGASLVDPASLKSASGSFPISTSLECSTSIWSPDNSQLYLSKSSFIKRYTPTECLLEDLYHGSDTVTCMEMKDNSNILFFAAANKVWSLDCTRSPGRIISSLEPHKHIVTRISISSDGTLLATVSSSAVFVHNLTLSSHTQLKGLPDRKLITCCLFHQHSRTKLLLGIGHDLLVYDSMRPSSPLKSIRIPGNGTIVGVATSPFSKTLVAAVTSNGDVVLVDLDKDNAILKTVNVKTPLTCCAFTVEGAAIYLGTESGKLLILDLRSLEKEPKSFTIGDGGAPIDAINVQGRSKSHLNDTASKRIKSASAAAVKLSPQRSRTVSTNSIAAGVKSPARATFVSRIRGGGGVTPKKKCFSPARTPLSETQNLGLDAHLAASRSPTLSRHAKPLRFPKSKEHRENGEAPAPPESTEVASARQRTSSNKVQDVEHLGLGSVPESISGHMAAMRVRSGSILNNGSREEVNHPKSATRRVASESVASASDGRKHNRTSSVSARSKVTSSRNVDGLARMQQKQERRPTTPDNTDDHLDLSSPELPCEPVTPISLGKHATKAPLVSATSSGVGMHGPEAVRWPPGESRKGKEKEKVVEVKKTRFAQHLDTKVSSGGGDESEDGGDAKALVDERRDGGWNQDLSLQVSPRRPTAPPTWLQSPHRPSAAGLNMNTAAQDFLRGIVHDVMYDMQRETKAELMGLHLDLVRMGRGWKQELREIMEEWSGEIQELKAENKRLKEENERLRRAMNQGWDPSSAVSVNALVFSGGEVLNEEEQDTQANRSRIESVPGPSEVRSYEAQNSAYVLAFEEMVGTVIKEETHLLNDEEFALLTVFAHLPYNARFLMVKLLLRKRDTWHRLDNLSYERELGSVSAIKDAIDEICKVAPQTLCKKEEPEEQGTVNLPMDGVVANFQQAQEKPALVGQEPLSEDRPLALARCEREMDLKSILECLKLDELKTVAKQLKLKINQKKDDLIRELLGASSSQSTLTDFACKDGVTPSKGRGCQTFRLRSQQDRLREIALRYIVKCVRVDDEFFGVIHRVNLVYFRITRYTPSILVAALLTRFGKRAYPGYDYERTKNVWRTRQALLNYEEVLNLEERVEMLLAGNMSPPGGRAVGDEDMIPSDKRENPRVRGAYMVKKVFEQVYPRWQDLVTSEDEEDCPSAGLQRFHYGHVLTRIICKCSSAFGTIEEHERELGVLEALLGQKRWRRGQRGRWHERRALILSTHLSKDEETMERALDAVIDALKDPDTHIVFRPKLQRRLTRLGNKLKIPIKERHTCEGILADAVEVVFEATRLRHRAASLKLDRTGRCIDPSAPQQGNQDIKRYYSPAVTKPKLELSAALPTRTKASSDMSKGKSLWLGRDGEELTVENLALQRYESQGFKGVHSETRVISMLFGLLFWDIIFQSVPGAFETPYQTAPLDIADDSFYHARKDLMEDRLAAIEAGQGVDLVQSTDASHRASATWCVGVQWDLFSSEDLVDIVTCIGGKALSVICRVLCEDYTSGTSGGPDLFLWNAEEGTCKFVEVKGPGDTLQENQRVWIDILLKAPVAVEICRIVESGDETAKKPNARTPKSRRKKAKKRKAEEMSVDPQDADALPIMVDDSHVAVEEEPVATRARSSRSPADPPSANASSTRAEETLSPLKRKASEVMSPSPSKRQRSS